MILLARRAWRRTRRAEGLKSWKGARRPRGAAPFAALPSSAGRPARSSPFTGTPDHPFPPAAPPLQAAGSPDVIELHGSLWNVCRATPTGHKAGPCWEDRTQPLVPALAGRGDPSGPAVDIPGARQGGAALELDPQSTDATPNHAQRSNTNPSPDLNPLARDFRTRPTPAAPPQRRSCPTTPRGGCCGPA
jgi:hypothetical protein